MDRRLVASSGLVLSLACTSALDPVPPEAGSEDGGSTGAPMHADTGDAGVDAGADAADTAADGDDTGAPVEPDRPWDHGWAIPATEQVPGDPEAGEWALLNEGYVTCGIPYDLFGLAAPLLGGMASEEPWPGRTGKNAEVPYNWTVHTAASGAEIVSLNCLECHVGRFDGELVMGLGRADADFTQNMGQALAGVPIVDLGIPGMTELAEMIERYQVVGDHMVMYTVGTNPADKLAVVLGAHRDQETLEWHDEPSYVVPDIVVPVDTPPWWRTAKKNGLFWNGMARGDHRGTLMFASSLCTDSVPEAESILAYFNNINAFIRSIEPPAYPFAIDEAMAEQGHDLYLGSCAGCHGTYAADPAEESYPNLLLPLDVIGTDPLIATQTTEQPFAEWYNGSFYGEITPLSPEDPFPGYVAPPLDGIWATAPFFHNASVPTLDLVLDSTARPERWRRVDYDSTSFDEEAIGWPWLEVPYAWEDAPVEERKHVYDTTKLGHWNTGHDFGDHFTPAERRAVIEYLKTI
jgi:hypothetical protein